VIELTHNHGTESNADFKYHNGNDEDKEGMTRGFGHTGVYTYIYIYVYIRH
jgi:lactoylglutathione lyase